MSLAAALDTLFADPVIAQPGTYTPAGGGGPAAVRVILNRGEERYDFNPRIGMISNRVMGELLAADLAAAGIGQPQENDLLETGGKTYRVTSRILLPPEALIWRLGLV